MPPESDTPKIGGSFDTIGVIFKEFGGLIGSIAGFATAVGVVWQSESEIQRWAVIAIAGLVLLYAIIAQVISPWIVRRRRQRVIDLEETEEGQRREAFRLRPYEERDHDDFDRPDGAHEKVLHWLDESDATCLYLTGFSGTGKSSLLQAWLIPELAVADRPVRTVVVRSFADPIGQLVEALKAEGAVPIDLPAEETDPLALLTLAADAMAARNGRLLIAIDQFEECLILQDQATKARLADLFAELQKTPMEGLQLLLVMRTDYLKFDELAAMNLPDPRPRETWFNLEALSHADARTILRQALPGMDRSLESQVIEEASDVDDLPGLIRPITLNMMGLILKNFAGAALTRTAPGRLIQDFLRRAIEKPGIERAAPALLAEMITDKGTKKPMAEAALAGATGIEPAMTRKTLYLLGEEGVVRELDRTRNIWEISHDFVARQLGQIIPRLRPSWWQQAQKATTPVALVAWLVILGAGYPIYQIWESAAIADDLRALGVRVQGEKGAYDITIDDRSNAEAIDRIFAHLRKLEPTSLVISDNQELQSLEGLSGLGTLTSLGIWGNAGLESLPPLDDLGALTSLEIVANSELQSLPPLDGLGALTRLLIATNAGLLSLPALDSLSGLASLEITANPKLQSLPSLDGLGALTSLAIRNSTGLESLPSLSGLGALTSLVIRDNASLLSLPPLDGLGALTSLDIRDNERLESLGGLHGLSSLTSLKIGDNDRLQSLPSLDDLGALATLEIWDNARLESLASLHGLGALTRLEIGANNRLDSLEGFDGLGALTSLEIWGNPRLQSLPALQTSTNLNSVRIAAKEKVLDLPDLDDLDRLEVVAFDAPDIEASVEALKGLPAGVTVETNYVVDEFAERLNQAREELGLKPLDVVRWGSSE